MTKTENLNLPQWEANDPIRRGDFNEAFAALDAAGGGVECVVINTSDKVVGDILYTFSKAPKFVILHGVHKVGILPADSTVTIIDYYSANSDYKVSFQLEGNVLSLTARTNTSAAKTLTIAVFY